MLPQDRRRLTQVPPPGGEVLELSHRGSKWKTNHQVRRELRESGGGGGVVHTGSFPPASQQG